MKNSIKKSGFLSERVKNMSRAINHSLVSRKAFIDIKKYIAGLTAVSLVFALSGCGTNTASGSISIKTTAAYKNKLDTSLNISGVLVPSETVNLVSKVAGQVLNVKTNVGDNVTKGTNLIRLETNTASAQLQQAQASLQAAQATLDSAANQEKQARLNLDTAERAYLNAKNLYDAGSMAKNDFDDISNKYELAKIQYQTASGSAKNQASATVKTAQASIKTIRVQLDNANIDSPINGVITNRNINVGEVASPGVTLLTIADMSTLKLKGTIPQSALPLVKNGQEINVSIDIYPNKPFKGVISNIGPMAVATGEYFPIEITIKNEGDIRAGLTAHASINLTTEETIIVPKNAVMQNNGQSYVFVINNNIATKKLVVIGTSNDKEIVILSGLSIGEKVATTNVNTLFDNMPVSAN